MSIHLATRDGIVCATRSSRPARTGDLSAVDCLRCATRFAHLSHVEADAAFDRRRLAGHAADCDELGIGHVWAMVAAADEPSVRMMRDLLGTIAHFLVETQARKQVAS